MVRFIRISFGISTVFMCLLQGCHSGTTAQAHKTYPTTVTPAQMKQALMTVYNNPKMTQAQKTATMNMLMSHLQVKQTTGNTSRGTP